MVLILIGVGRNFVLLLQTGQISTKERGQKKVVVKINQESPNTRATLAPLMYKNPKSDAMTEQTKEIQRGVKFKYQVK